MASPEVRQLRIIYFKGSVVSWGIQILSIFPLAA